MGHFVICTFYLIFWLLHVIWFTWEQILYTLSLWSRLYKNALIQRTIALSICRLRSCDSKMFMLKVEGKSMKIKSVHGFLVFSNAQSLMCQSLTLETVDFIGRWVFNSICWKETGSGPVRLLALNNYSSHDAVLQCGYCKIHTVSVTVLYC